MTEKPDFGGEKIGKRGGGVAEKKREGGRTRLTEKDSEKNVVNRVIGSARLVYQNHYEKKKERGKEEGKITNHGDDVLNRGKVAVPFQPSERGKKPPNKNYQRGGNKKQTGLTVKGKEGKNKRLIVKCESQKDKKQLGFD